MIVHKISTQKGKLVDWMSELNAFTLESEEGARALESDLIAAQEARELKAGMLRWS